MARVVEKGSLAGRSRESDAISYRPVRAVGLLLMLEVACIAGLAALELLGIEWRRVLAAETAPPREVIEAAAVVLFAPAVVLTFLASLGFLLLRRRGWLLAAISQGLVLAVCLWLYTEHGPVYVYPVMAYAVLMILYLNVHDVRAVFYPGEDGGGVRSRD